MTATLTPTAPATGRATRRRTTRGRIPRSGARPLTWITLVVLAAYSVGPLLVFVFNAFKTPSEISQSPIGLPQVWHWGNFAQAFTDAHMGRGLLNSAVISLSAAAGVCVISSMAAYAMTVLDVPWKGAWILYLLVSTSLPIQLFLVPLLSWWSTLNLYNSQFGLIVIYWAVYSPFATMLLRSFLLGIPKEFAEAARLDGAGEVRLFTRVTVPMIWPGILTVALITGLQAYNEFLLAVTFIQDDSRLPVSLSLYSFQQNYSPNMALVSAAGLIMAMPVVIVFLLLQKRFIEGYTQGGLAN